MIHENPTGNRIKVLIPADELAPLRRLMIGLPKKGFIQLDFSSGGYCLSIKPTGLPPKAKKILEQKARRYLAKELR